MAIHKSRLFEEGFDGLKQEVFDCEENVYGLVKTHYQFMKHRHSQTRHTPFAGFTYKFVYINTENRQVW
jgi:hypothetical protein